MHIIRNEDGNIPFHPYSEMFPMMSPEDMGELAKDIKEHGLIEPIVIFEGKVLDGRHRLTCCALVAVEPRFVEFDGDDPIAYVYSKNETRRHLSVSQRAMAKAKMLGFYEVKAKERQDEGRKKGGETAGRGRPKTNSLVANLPPSYSDDEVHEKSRDKASKDASVSPRSLQDAKKVLKDGTPELQKAVQEDKIKISTAADLADLPPDEQRSVVSLDDKREITKKAKEAKAKRQLERNGLSFDVGNELGNSETYWPLTLAMENIRDKHIKDRAIDDVVDDFMKNFPWHLPLFVQRLEGSLYQIEELTTKLADRVSEKLRQTVAK